MRLPYRESSKAILIGTSDYAHASFGRLPAVERNLSGLYAALTDKDHGAFSPKDCRVVHNPSNPEALGKVLREHCASATDTVLIYLSGHGLIKTERSFYIALGQTDRSHCEFTALIYDEHIRRMLRWNHSASNRIVIVDCCYSGNAIPAMGDDATDADATVDIEGAYVMTATRRDTLAYAPKNATYTAFTGELIDILSNGIEGGERLLTLDAVYRELRRRSVAKQLPDPDASSRGMAGELALVYNPRHPSNARREYRLAIDLGTYSAKAVRHLSNNAVLPLRFDDNPHLPSAVCSATSDLLTGLDALREGAEHPDRLERYPKRHLAAETVRLGEREFDVADVIGATVGRIAAESFLAARMPPGDVVLTYPTGMSDTDQETLQLAARRAGLPHPRLVPESLAALEFFADDTESIPPGGYVMVYDFGAAKLSVTILHRTPDGRLKLLASRSAGNLGGYDVDKVLMRHVEQVISSTWPDAGKSFLFPQTEDDRRAVFHLRENVRLAKEALSQRLRIDLSVPVVDQTISLSREDLERVAQPLLAKTLTVADRALRSAAVDTNSLAGVLLLGGSSHLPGVARMLQAKFGTVVKVVDEPAAFAEGAARRSTAPLGGPGPSEDEPATDTFPSAPSQPTPDRLPAAPRPPQPDIAWLGQLRRHAADPLTAVLPALLAGVALGVVLIYGSAGLFAAIASATVTLVVVYGVLLAALTAQSLRERRTTPSPGSPHR